MRIIPRTAQDDDTSIERLGFELDLLPVGSEKKSGDAILLRFGNLFEGKEKQTVVLIDGGYAETAITIKEHLKKYYKCQNKNGKYQIDLMILSHPDNDHVSGLVELSKDEDIEVKAIMMHRPWDEVDNLSLFKDGRKTHNSLEKKLEEAFIKAYELDKNTSGCIRTNITQKKYKFRDAYLTILGPSQEFYRNCILACPKTPEAIVKKEEPKSFISDNDEEQYCPGNRVSWDDDESTSVINESSLIILFEYIGYKILFTGDAGKRALNEAINFAQNQNIKLDDIDIIKMPHHGSRKNVNPEILEKIGETGTVCLFSTASGDLGHHPSKRLINLLNYLGYQSFSTSGNNICYRHNSPLREGYDNAEQLPVYSTMDK